MIDEDSMKNCVANPVTRVKSISIEDFFPPKRDVE